MADFLVTFDGKYLYYGIIRYLDVPLLNDLIDWTEEYLGLESQTFSHEDLNVLFNDYTGRVQVYNKFMAVSEEETKLPKGYIEIEKFWERAEYKNKEYTLKLTGEVTTQDLTLYRKFTGTIISTIPQIDKVKPKEGDRVILVRRVIDENIKLKTIQKSFLFPSSNHSMYEIIKDGLDYNVTDGLITINQNFDNDVFFQALNFSTQTFEETLKEFSPLHSLEDFYTNIIGNGILRGNDSTPSALNSAEIEYVEGITLLFNQLFNLDNFIDKLNDYGYKILFEKYLDIFQIPIYNSGSVLTQDEYYSYFNERYLSLLYVRLHEFYLWARRDIFKSEFELLGWIAGVLGEHALRYLNFEKKIELLQRVLEDNWWVSGRWNPFESKNKLTEEEILVAIVKSIKVKDQNGILNYTNINDFMDLLKNSPFYEATTSSKTLYQVLYSKINDDVLLNDTGEGAKGQFVKAVYNLWADSKYNPSNDLLPENDRIMPDYTNYHALWKYDDANQTNEIDYTAKPLLINYESEKFLLWYNDNFEFPFYKDKILASREVSNSGYEITLKTLANLLTPFKTFDFTKYIPYGYYDIFDPVSIRHTNTNDTIIKIPLSVASLQNPCDVNEANNNNEIPIFFLKYVNDLANYSNFKETIGTTLDVALTFTGVGGIVTKIRYLNKASVLRRYLSPALRSGLSFAERQLITRTLRQVTFASWEIILGTAGILHSMSTSSCTNYLDPCNPLQPGDPNYEQYQDCQAIQGWLLALEIFTLSGDLLAKRYFRKKSFELRQRITEQRINDFPDNLIDNDVPITKQQANDLLEELASLNIHLDNFMLNLQQTHPTVYAKVDAFTDTDKKFAFMFDFENAHVSVLDELNLSPDLIDNWLEVEHLFAHRKKLNFLKAYKRIKGESGLLNHVHLGDSRLISNPPNPTGAEITGYHNPNKLVNPPPGAGQISFKGTIDYTNPNDIFNSYTQGKIERNMYDYTDPSTNAPWKQFNSNPPNHMKVKKAKNVFWPSSYNTQRINEEMALVLSSIKQAEVKVKIDNNNVISYFYKAKATDGHTIEVCFRGGNLNSGTLETIYPAYF